MRALVTGGAGFIGSHLIDRLVARGDEVVVIDNLSSGDLSFIQGHLDSGAAVLIEGDICNPDDVGRAMAMNIDCVFHLAANPDIRLGTRITDTDLKQGTVATYNIVEAMRLNDVKNIAFASSSVVYGENAPMPTPENHGPCMPISLYGASKQAGEGLISSWVGTFGLKAWIFRFANIIGARGTHGVIFDFIHKLKKDPSRLEVLGNGLQEKSYMEVGDCVDGILHVMEHANEPSISTTSAATTPPRFDASQRSSWKSPAATMRASNTPVATVDGLATSLVPASELTTCWRVGLMCP